jgi:hypothetical protein
MKLKGLNFIRRIVAHVVEEKPPRTLAEQDRLERPRTEEGRILLAFVPTLDRLPVDGPIRDLLPAIKLVLEDVALDCEATGAEAAERRAQVTAWLCEMRKALAA